MYECMHACMCTSYNPHTHTFSYTYPLLGCQPSFQSRTWPDSPALYTKQDAAHYVCHNPRCWRLRRSQANASSACVCMFAWVFVCMSIHVCFNCFSLLNCWVYINIHTYTHTCIHSYIQTYMHTKIHTDSSLPSRGALKSIILLTRTKVLLELHPYLRYIHEAML